MSERMSNRFSSNYTWNLDKTLIGAKEESYTSTRQIKSGSLAETYQLAAMFPGRVFSTHC